MSSTFQPGKLISGKYRIVRTLGEGGIGIVVEAEHIGLGQTVAIKFLRPEVTDSELSARFLREARASVRLSGEHVTKVTDVGEEDGAAYMVMEYLRGQDLDQVLHARGPLPIQEAVGYILQALVGIAEAHAQGIVHRDLKPANLFLARRADGTPLVKVLDFGISKVDGLDDGASTSTAVVMGSPFYMSPEQMISTKDVDVRTDIWALGVILFQLVSGKLPFREDSIPALTLKLHTQAAPTLRSVLPSAPAALEAVIGRCLAKDRQARFLNVGALARALAPFAAPGDVRLIESVSTLAGGEHAATVRLSGLPEIAEPGPGVNKKAIVLGGALLLSGAFLATYLVASSTSKNDATQPTAGSGAVASTSAPTTPAGDTSNVAIAPPAAASTPASAPATSAPPPPSATATASAALPSTTRKPPATPGGGKKPEVDPFGTSRR